MARKLLYWTEHTENAAILLFCNLEMLKHIEVASCAVESYAWFFKKELVLKDSIPLVKAM